MPWFIFQPKNARCELCEYDCRVKISVFSSMAPRIFHQIVTAYLPSVYASAFYLPSTTIVLSFFVHVSFF